MKNKIIESYNKFHEDAYFQNLIAQSYSRSTLRDINEPLENYPKYDDKLDIKLLMLVQLYLNTAFKISGINEDEELSKIRNDAFKISADLLKNLYYYGAIAAEKEYYLLISSMTYYVTGDFSKSFALMKNFNQKNKISNIISLFLKKDYQNLFVESVSFEDVLEKLDNEEFEQDTFVYIKILTEAMKNYLNYLTSGNENYINNAINNISDLIILAEIDKDILAWYIFKLLKLLFEKFNKVSLWNVLPPLLGEKNDVIDKYILSNLFNFPSIVELFQIQISAVKISMNDSGAVIAIPTSSGKTKIAEINILKAMIEDPNAIILYLAPYKSLAYEIETSLAKNLTKLNINVSNMYGDETESLFDNFLQGDSQVLIVTPEKAKMMLRNNEEVKSRIKLVILDEGHLIGKDLRFTRNEIFYEELKYYVVKMHGKFLVLSAVLPNTEHIAKWLNGNEGYEYSSLESMNEKRFGVLIYQNNNVTIKWRGKSNPFNHNFVDSIPVSKKRIMPKNKREAIMLSAVKFSNSGKVLIYLARKDMIKGYINDYSMILDNLENNNWDNEVEWEKYKIVLKNYYGENSEYEKVAEKGIIIHHASLPNDLRMATERLLRNSNPKIIIATSTLGQGVNIGVSTILIGHYRPAKNLISKGEFNNIIGRAGRSYTDIEGKVLFAIDGSQGRGKVKYEAKIFEEFIDGPIEKVESGVFFVLKKIYQLSQEADINFETLLELISSNENFENDTNLYLLDDTLLALLNEEDFKVESLEKIVTSSFSYLLAKNKAEEFNEEKLKQMILTRARFIKRTYQDSDKKELYLKSGIAISFVKYLESFQDLLESILVKENYLNELVTLLIDISNSELNLYRSGKNSLNADQIISWLSGDRVKAEIFTNFDWGKLYYELPLVINTFSKILLMNQREDLSVKLLELNECMKYGLPNIDAVKLYLIGINSREAATKISEKYSNTIPLYDNQLSLKIFILNEYENITKEFKDYEFHPIINSWYESHLNAKNLGNEEKLLTIRVLNVPDEIKKMRVISTGNRFYLISIDFQFKLQIGKEVFSEYKYLINELIYYFERRDQNTFILKKFIK
ncbi:DEAD/DEAH box helicase [Paenisporosarcina antarctica]|nr:DEAD/DEAH box helicase [Paenisporosarcina antarctica]